MILGLFSLPFVFKEDVTTETLPQTFQLQCQRIFYLVSEDITKKISLEILSYKAVSM